MNITKLDRTDSTNSYVTRNSRDFVEATLVYAIEQTAGRGQRGNSWEAEPGKNLTLTVFYPWEEAFPALRQFSVSEAVALSVVDLLAGEGIEARAKWPNDIYVGDRKICGILIQHSVTGSGIEHSVIGIGLNVNQLVFRSLAPNPVSMAQLAGHEWALDELVTGIAGCLSRRLDIVKRDSGREELHKEFLGKLWRGDGRAYSFRDVACDVRFAGMIEDVETGGTLCIRSGDGDLYRFAFKEVEFL